jgi:serine/threonine kinase 16
MLRLFLGTCEAVRAMHTYVPGPSATYPPNASSSSSTGQSRYRRTDRKAEEDDEDADDDEGRHLAMEDAQAVPLIGSGGRGGDVEEENDERNISGLADGGGATTNGRIVGRLSPTPHDSGGKEGELQPWAHRDIKPGTVILAFSPPIFFHYTDGTRPVFKQTS